jgi:hypothetical protein
LNRLEGIFEGEFLDVSYGFRPNRRCHDALNAIDKCIMTRPINYVVNMDIEKFFDTVEHKWLIEAPRVSFGLSFPPYFVFSSPLRLYLLLTLSLRLPESIHRHIREIAKKEGVSINQFISSAVSEKISALLTEDYLKARAKRAKKRGFQKNIG